MFEVIQNRYPLIGEFFKAFIQNSSVPNSMILYGPDTAAQYFAAMLLARAANCTGDGTFTCNCQNCRWIKENKHPEIVTISETEGKPDYDESKTVISIKQTDMIKDRLVHTSDYRRFFIFCSSADDEISEGKQKHIESFKDFEIKLPETAKGSWYPSGLEAGMFPTTAANSLLKSIEEPPVGVTFIFLTEVPENIISTIVSRSQLFYIPGKVEESYDYSFAEPILSNYPDIPKQKSVAVSEQLIEYTNKTGVGGEYTIACIQQYLCGLAKANTSDFILRQKILLDCKELNKCALMIKSNVKEQIVFEEVSNILTV